jgi:hypothetical protein
MAFSRNFGLNEYMKGLQNHPCGMEDYASPQFR